MLDQWWTSGSTRGAMAVLVGPDGVGKTWAGLDWLIGDLNRQPIVVTMPSSFLGNARVASGAGVRRLIAEKLWELTEVRTIEFWIARLGRLLRRPTSN